MNRQAVAVLLLLLGCACISSNQAIRPGGDEARIALKNGVRHNAELLAVTQTDIYFVSDQHVWRSPLADITSVHVEGYSLRTWKYVTLGVLGAADAALVWISFSNSTRDLAGVFSGLFVAGALWTLLDEPSVDFRPPLAEEAGAQLALYCRYPRSLADEQWQELLRFYHQDTFLSPGESPKP